MSRSAPRLYLTGQWSARQQIALPPDRSHYLAAVLRAQPGMEVLLFNAECGEWTARVASIAKKTVTLELLALERPMQPERERYLLFAPIKRANLEWLIEKATELGVTRLVPVLTERTQMRELNAARLEAIVLEAAEQCERLSLPWLEPLQPLASMLAGWSHDRPLHVALERCGAEALAGIADVSAILIGPEGGFSAEEQVLLQRHSFVVPVTLGPRILRAETAALAALSHLALQD